MKTRKTSIKTSKLQAGIKGGAMLAIAFSGVALGGPLGAVGDTYVIASASSSTPVVLQYDGLTGNLEGTFATRGGGGFLGIAWGPNGNLFASHSIGGQGRWRIAEFDGETGVFIQNVIEVLDNSFSLAKGLTFGPDGDLYVGDFFRGRVARYDGTTFAEIASTPGGSIGTPNGMHFAPNGNLMVLSGGFNKVMEYDVSDGFFTLLGDFATAPGSVQPQDFTWGPNGNMFIARGTAGGVAEFDGTTGAFLGDFVPIDSILKVNGLVFDNHNRLLTSMIFPLSRVDAYDATTGAPLGPFLTGGLGGAFIPTIISIKPGAPSTSCNPADLAEPFGELNFFDVSEFLVLFGANDPAADLNKDGQFNFFDISTFLSVFSAGCP